MKKKYILAIVMVLIFMFLAGCGGASDTSSSSVSQQAIVKDDILVYIGSQDDPKIGDLYMIVEDEERKRIASNVIEEAFVFLGNNKALLYVDKDQNLYYQSAEGERVSITNEVIPYSLVVSEDESAFAYLKGDSWDLYIQHIVDDGVNDRIRVDSDIYIGAYSLSMDGSILAYFDNKNTLYIKEGTESSRRIASNAFDAYVTDDNKTIIFLNDKRELYIRNTEEDDNRKVNASSVGSAIISHANKNIVYLADYNFTSYKGELFVLEKDESPKWIASDVKRFETYELINKFYFINDDNALFYRDIKEDNNTLIASNVYDFVPNFTNEEVLYITDDDTMYLSGKDQERKRIAGNLVDYTIVSDILYYINDDEELYLYDFDNDPVKVASSVKYFNSSENGTALAYYNENKEVFVLSNNQEEKRVIKDADKYSKVYISNEVVFEKMLGLSDLVGIWENQEDNIFMEILRDGTLIVYDDEVKGEMPIQIQGDSETTGGLEGNLSQAIMQYHNGEYTEHDNDYPNEYTYLFYVDMLSNDIVIVDGDRFKRVNRETLNKKLEEFKERAAYEVKVSKVVDLGYDLWQTWVEIPAGTECRTGPSRSSQLIGDLQYTDTWYVVDYHVDDDINLWIQIEIYDGYTYDHVWLQYN
ncbi:hypothetical protein SAMN05660297_00554 [Natronincola peptidivorans]|uniref:Uncharacterized protein n=1 Tax=Natronincola peptidivorans TaxID=426128 RepID=A0A1H9ZHG4_9FIRM|nr:hypothetical protein [Natronincola peptidivorans]SES81040.1 hypothetical protein SAMN05660297_00554 [Natronincola peptidivorans]